MKEKLNSKKADIPKIKYPKVEWEKGGYPPPPQPNSPNLQMPEQTPTLLIFRS